MVPSRHSMSSGSKRNVPHATRRLRHVRPRIVSSPTAKRKCLSPSATVTALAVRSGVCRSSSERSSSTALAAPAAIAAAASHDSLLAGENTRGEIAVAAVADDGDDHGVSDLARNLESGPQRAARGNAGKDTLFARKQPRRLLGVGLRHLDHAVNALPVANTRQIFRRPFADARYLRAVGRLATNDLYGGILLLEEARASHDRSGRAHARHKMGDGALRIAPDLGAGPLVVRKRIVGVGELIEDHA